MLLVGDGRKSTGREKAHNTFFAVLDRIAEIVEAFPCLYFRVRLAFRHQPLLCPALEDAFGISSLSKRVHSQI